MAHRIPREGLEHTGDYERWRVACWFFLFHMMEKDPRVRAHWRAWQEARQIPVWAQRARDESPVSDETFQRLTAALLHPPDPDDLEDFRRLVHDELQIPYIWVPAALRDAFGQWTAFELDLEVPTAYLFTIPLRPDFPVTPGPWNDGQDIMRRVLWLYRTKYDPAPRISIKALAKEWAIESGRPDTDLRWEVKQGIKQANAFLDLARY